MEVRVSAGEQRALLSAAGFIVFPFSPSHSRVRQEMSTQMR
jgi:hypothetical protein